MRVYTVGVKHNNWLPWYVKAQKNSNAGIWGHFYLFLKLLLTVFFGLEFYLPIILAKADWLLFCWCYKSCLLIQLKLLLYQKCRFCNFQKKTQSKLLQKFFSIVCHRLKFISSFFQKGLQIKRISKMRL